MPNTSEDLQETKATLVVVCNFCNTYSDSYIQLVEAGVVRHACLVCCKLNPLNWRLHA